MIEPLLAKSVREGTPPPDAATLPGHLWATFKAAQAVLSSTGAAQLAAMGIGFNQLARFSRIVLLAAALHDLGKANDHFQGRVRGRRGPDQPQGLRHEWVTTWILGQSCWREWLAPGLANLDDWHLLTWAICGHHREPKPEGVVPGAGGTLTVILDHPDMLAALGWLRTEFSTTGALPALETATIKLSGTMGTVFAWINRLVAGEARFWDTLGAADRRLAAAAKACLIAADVAASALGARDVEPVGWITHALASTPGSIDLASIVRSRLAGEDIRPFQRAAAEDGGAVTLVRAGCGSGKTIAAYNWAAVNHPDRRLYFCYPTTGTATEGFREYLTDPDLDAVLAHSRAAIDLELIVGTPEEIIDDQARLDSLQAWFAPVVSCTADTVLGLVQNQRRGLYAWPALVQGAFVFDEIHAYDDKLFGALLRFLEACPGLPCLLMTASLPAGRLDALREVVDREAPQLRIVDGPADLEELKRYVRHEVSGKDEAISLVRQSFGAGEKVLVVCNTVGSAMSFSDDLRDLSPIIYHSRFRYEDRVRRHKGLIAAFKSAGPALAVCTQVAEVSLDISADLLVTELAPVPSLIQRLGRLNRRSRPDNPAPAKQFVVLLPGNRLPYDSEDLALGRTWIQALGGGYLSQRDLVAAWRAVDSSTPPRPEPSAWLDGGPVTEVRELREASPGLTVLLPADAPAVRQDHRLAVRFALPMPPPPKGVRYQDWQRIASLLVPEDSRIQYDPLRGAQWRK